MDERLIWKSMRFGEIWAPIILVGGGGYKLFIGVVVYFYGLEDE